jgi:hypothetical protein
MMVEYADSQVTCGMIAMLFWRTVRLEMKQLQACRLLLPPISRKTDMAALVNAKTRGGSLRGVMSISYMTVTATK